MATERKRDILQLLRNSTEYVSGQQICDSLGVSRTAVWKIMKQLKEEGYQIEAVQNKGYLLTETPDVLSKNELESRMQTKWAAKKVYYFDKTGSTNVEAKHEAELGAPHGTLVVADSQSDGRGRRGRSWEAKAGENIFMTLLLRPEFAPDRASMLTLLMALATAQAVEECCQLQAKIKWPNDLVVNGKKICGILTEMSMERDYIQHVVIGVGINVNQLQFDGEIEQKATSLRIEGKQTFSRAELIQHVMENFEKQYTLFTKTLDLSALMGEYNKRLVSMNKQVRILDPKGEYEGISQGITNEGELIVRKPDQTVEKVYAGEVSVRGLYGYV